MAKFNVGDRVKIGNIMFNNVWPGCEATITKVDDSGYGTYYRADVDGPAVNMAEYDHEPDEWTVNGNFSERDLTLVAPASEDPLGNLANAVVRARAAGYEVIITVKETVTTVKEHTL